MIDRSYSMSFPLIHTDIHCLFMTEDERDDDGYHCNHQHFQSINGGSQRKVKNDGTNGRINR